MNFKVFVPTLVAVLFGACLSIASPIPWPVEDGGNGHLYEAILIGESGITWTDADLMAQAMGPGWHLATITSAAENSFVYSLVKDDISFWENWSGTGQGPWLGGLKSSGVWSWVTGEPFSYTNWAPGEPFNNGDRLTFWNPYSPSPGSKWNDVYATSLRPRGFIVENSSGGVPSHPLSWSRVKSLFR